MKKGAIDGVSVAIALGIVTWVSLSLWWRISIQVNSAIGPQVPYFLLLAFGPIFLARRFIFFGGMASRTRLRKEFPSQALSALFGVFICLVVALLCFSFSNEPAAEPSPDEPLRGTARLISAYAFPTYIAVVEEAAFRGQLQRRVASHIGKTLSVIIATGAFLALHWQNVEFESYWPMYVVVGLVCGILAANYLSMVGALLVHATVNLLGVSFVPLLNRSSPMLSTHSARALLFICLLVFAASFGHGVRRHLLKEHSAV
jgi:membrane protease YdiL (CAAX protease family)